jgi:hypothetical protein
LSDVLYDTVAKGKSDARVMTRLDEEEQAILRRARALTGKNTSGVIKAALRAYARTLPGATPLEIFERCGVVGASEGPVDLSATYKARIDYAAKHGKKR